jgi:DNA-binding IclR family transcriptional regulator
MTNWSLLTNHAKVLLFLGRDGDSRLRDIAGALDVTERTAHNIISDLTDAGYVAKEKDGRRNVYHIQAHLPLHDSNGERAVGELLSLFDDSEPAKE